MVKYTRHLVEKFPGAHTSAFTSASGASVKTVDFLDQYKAARGIKSDYALAKFWDVKPQRISEYRTGRVSMGEERALEVAAVIGLDPGYVFACMRAERSIEPGIRQIWERMALRFATAALLTFGILPVAMMPEEARAASLFSVSINLPSCKLYVFAKWLFDMRIIAAAASAVGALELLF